jgi:hypothetical protein
MLTPHPKTMARTLREALAERDLAISHSTALELVARQFGYADWNVLAAQIPTDPPASPACEPAAGSLPEGWHASGRSDLFRYDVQPNKGPGGVPALLIASRAPQEAAAVARAGDFLTIMQRFSAAPYRGRVVSFRARIACTQATGSGRIWIHARSGARETLAFDNLGLEPGPDGPITGTTDWTRRSVTIEIPQEALYVGFGVLFGSGTGIFQAADVSFGLAAEDERPRPLPDMPRNLDLTVSAVD